MPRLAYIGDVPVESSYHGSALLYRLLEDYLADDLLIVECGSIQSLLSRRLKGVSYESLSLGCERWRNTRFHNWAGTWLTLSASSSAARLRRLIHNFKPDAVLTVAHGYSWITAARFAADANLPLYLIVHDDLPTSTPVVSQFNATQEKIFKAVYAQAASRLCVSPFMEREYYKRYGLHGEVLYPSRAKQTPPLEEPPATYRKKSGALVGAYAGNIFNAGYARLIGALASRLSSRNGHLLSFGSPESLKHFGLDRPDIIPQGLLPSEEMIAQLRDKADFLFLPMAFGPAFEMNMRISFPSKLVDYSATGLPVLICGPEHCSAVQWARQYEPVAEVITSDETTGIDAALERFTVSSYRENLGRAAAAVGNKLFSHEAAVNLFFTSLCRSRAERLLAPLV